MSGSCRAGRRSWAGPTVGAPSGLNDARRYVIEGPTRSVHGLMTCTRAGLGWLTFERADACALPERVLRGGYDLVFSNSVVEHLGGQGARTRLSDQVHRAPPRHRVQTPYRRFPVEPHWLFPAFQFLPMHPLSWRNGSGA